LTADEINAADFVSKIDIAYKNYDDIKKRINKLNSL
jgi:hypothetical protein